MARFRIEIGDNNNCIDIGNNWHGEKVLLSELDDFINALRAAAAFAMANADLPKVAEAAKQADYEQGAKIEAE